MKTQFGKQNLINLATGNQAGLGTVVAEGYRVVSVAADRASERLSPGCCGESRSMRSLHQHRDRLDQPVDPCWRSFAPKAPTTINLGAATSTATVEREAPNLANLAVDNRLPAPAWAAFVLNHALCG